MRIAFFVHNFPPEFRGGTELVVHGLAKTLQAEGDDVFVVSGSEVYVDGGRMVEEQYDGLRVLRIHRDPSEVYGLDLAYPITGPRISELISNEHPDTIHVHHWSTLGWDILQRAAAMGIRGGATLHDLWVTCPRFFRQPQNGLRCPVEGERDSCPACVQRDLTNVPINFVEDAIKVRDHRIRRELGLASFISVPSESSAKLVRKHLPWGGKIVVIPHGLLKQPRSKVKARPAESLLRVGSFGNLVHEKGVDLLIEALAETAKELVLKLSGHCPDPKYREYLQALAKDLGVQLELKGSYGPNDPHPALDLDLAVFPSLCHETYGLVVEEALAHGVPVVVSSRGALPERAAGNGGIVVRSGGIMPLRITLLKLIRSRSALDALRAAIPDRFPGLERAAKHYRLLLQESLSMAD